MKFDYIIGNPPYADGKGVKNLHLECVNYCVDMFNDKMVIVMPIIFLKQSNAKINKFKKAFDSSLIEVTEYKSTIFEGTTMPNIGVYVFNKGKKADDKINIYYLGKHTLSLSSLLDGIYDKTTNDILSYLETSKDYSKHIYTAVDKKKLKYCYNLILKERLPKQKRYKNLIHVENPSYIVCNGANGRMTGTYFTPKTNFICEGTDNMIEKMVERGGAVAIILFFNSLKEAENCKKAMMRPLLRFACYIAQVGQNMRYRVYKYIPNIDWQNPKCLTDEGILEMCGCSPDVAKEYAAYAKEYVETRDKEIQNKKKRKCENFLEGYQLV